MDKQEEKLETKTLLSYLPLPHIKSNALRRTITGLTLVAYFHVIVYYGLPVILIHALAIEIKCHDEIINIAIKAKKVPNVMYFRTLNWYFVIIANYFFFGETFGEHLELFIEKYYVVKVLFSYHRFLSFCFYFLGIVWFLVNVRREIIRQQFSLLAWTHFLLIIIGLQTYMVVQNIFEGIVWLVIPVCLVILNDVFAYVFGMLLGRTPLISLSPKKTVEGFVFGGISTLILGTVLSYIFCHVPFLICPVKFLETGGGIVMDTNCTPSYLFQPVYHSIGDAGVSIKLFPFLLHSLVISLFASIIAPFGGFCASGFKRAFKVKDFSDFIPGHGGLTDRFDCQFLMATFVNVYIWTFIRIPQVEKVYQKVFQLSEENQLKFYLLLNESLHTRGLIND